MSRLPYSPDAFLVINEPREDDSPHTDADEVAACALRIDELQRDLDTTTRTAAACAAIAGNTVRAAEAERDATLAKLADMTAQRDVAVAGFDELNAMSQAAMDEISSVRRNITKRVESAESLLAELRSVALLARDCQRNGDTFGVTLQCGLILNALLGADAVGSAAPGVAMREEAA